LIQSFKFVVNRECDFNLCWGSKPEDYKCRECDTVFPFKIDTLFIASHDGLPIKCPKCKSNEVEQITKSLNNTIFSDEIIKEFNTRFLIISGITAGYNGGN